MQAVFFSFLLVNRGIFLLNLKKFVEKIAKNKTPAQNIVPEQKCINCIMFFC